MSGRLEAAMPIGFMENAGNVWSSHVSQQQLPASGVCTALLLLLELHCCFQLVETAVTRAHYVTDHNESASRTLVWPEAQHPSTMSMPALVDLDFWLSMSICPFAAMQS